jgi:hypothetical protein
VAPGYWPGYLITQYGFNQNQQKTTPMNNNSEPERDPAVNTDYSAEEAEQMGAFAEDALSFEDVRESIEDFESGK